MLVSDVFVSPTYRRDTCHFRFEHIVRNDVALNTCVKLKVHFDSFNSMVLYQPMFTALTSSLLNASRFLTDDDVELHVLGCRLTY